MKNVRTKTQRLREEKRHQARFQDYLLVSEAIDAGLLTVTEVNEAGSVPELLAISPGPRRGLGLADRLQRSLPDLPGRRSQRQCETARTIVCFGLLAARLFAGSRADDDFYHGLLWPGHSLV